MSFSKDEILFHLDQFCNHNLLNLSNEMKREKLCKLKDMTICMNKAEQVQEFMIQNNVIEYFGIEINRLMPNMREEQFHVVLGIFAILQDLLSGEEED